MGKLSALPEVTTVSDNDYLISDTVPITPTSTSKVKKSNLLTGYYKHGGTPVSVADGGTGAATAATARTNLGAAEDSAVVHNTGDESIAGTKTFTGEIIVPAPTNPTDAVTKAYADSIAGSSVWGGITGTLSNQLDLSTALSAKADDSAVVHNTGIENIAGVKTFTSAPVVPSASFPESAVTNLTTDLAAKAADTAVVHNTGDETVAGIKTFSSSPVVPDSSFTEAKVTNLTADLAAKATDTAVVHNTGAEAVAGVKTFSSSPIIPSPSGSTDAANKAYVDAAAIGLSVRTPVKASTTGALAANTYNNGTLGVGATLTANANGALAAQDGVTLSVGNRLLVQNEATGAKNGVYTVTTVGDGSNPYVLTRATDMDQTGEFSGAYMLVTGGTLYTNSAFYCTNTGSITVGTTPVTFAQFSAAQTITAGTGLTLTTNVMSLTSPVAIANGGTGSTTKNFIDLTTDQTAAGVKTFSGEVVVPVPVNSTDAATKAYVDGAIAPDATTLVKGKVQLANDLGGTAALPTTPTAVHLAGSETVTGAKIFNIGSILDKGNVVYNVKSYGAKGDTVNFADGAITSGLAVLTSATANFVVGDVGKAVLVQGAGTSAGKSLNTTISAYTSSTQVTLASTAGTTVSGATFYYGTDDQVAISAAVTAANAAGGGTVFYPAGGYASRNTTPGGVVNNIWFRGAGRGATTLYTLNQAYALSLGQNSTAGAISKNLAISDLTIDMCNNTNPNTYGMTALMCQDVTIDNVHYKNQKNGAKSFLFFGVSSGSSDNFPRNLLVSNSTFSDSDAAWEGITLGQCFNAKFVNCVFRDKTSQGMILNYDCYEFSMANCETTNATHYIDGGGTSTITGCQHFGGGWLVNGAYQGDVSFIGGSFRSYNGIYQGAISITAQQAGDTENAWDGVPGSMSVRPNITIIGTEFEGCNTHAVASNIFQDRNGIWRSPIKNFTMVGCTVHDTAWQGISVAADFINLSDCNFKNNRVGPGVGSSAGQNLAVSGGVIKLRNITSTDDQAVPTIVHDVYIDQQASTLQAFPQTLLYVEDCYLTRGSGIIYYNGSFVSTPPANVFVFPRGNIGVSQSTSAFSLDEKGGGLNLAQIPTPSAPTVTPKGYVTDGVTTNASATITSATANFVSGDVGLTISGTGIPIGTTISSVTNSTTAVMSANATATNTLIYFTIGRSGVTAATYFIVAIDRAGNKTLASASGSTGTGFASLSAVNFNQITWAPVRGAVQYDILKTDTAHKVATVTNTLTYNDIGTATVAYTNPTRNATADAVIAGRLTLSSSPTTGYVLTSDASGNATWRPNAVIFDHFIDAGNTGTSQTDLYSDTIPASQLGVNGDKLRASYGGIFVSSATATRELKVFFGGTAIFDSGTIGSTIAASWTLDVMLIRVSATVVRYRVDLNTEGAALSAYTSVGELTGLTLSSTNILKVTGQAASTGAATNDIVAKLGTVEWLAA